MSHQYSYIMMFISVNMLCRYFHMNHICDCNKVSLSSENYILYIKSILTCLQFSARNLCGICIYRNAEPSATHACTHSEICRIDVSNITKWRLSLSGLQSSSHSYLCCLWLPDKEVAGEFQ